MTDTLNPYRFQLRDAARKKLVKLLARKTLEQIAIISRPWSLDRPALELHIVEHWDSDAIESAFHKLLVRANMGDLTL